VPPEHLADYIVEFRALLDSHGLSYGMFGHVDAGVLHVRPALDMCDPQQEILMKQISDDVVALTAKYGGLLWGEHGKGFRAEYSPAFFGEQLYAELRKVKAAFDPHNRLNPGKICPPKALMRRCCRWMPSSAAPTTGRSRLRCARPGAARWSVTATACALTLM
jgi:FAD/FMN-containing dehydrogenase